MRLVSDESVHIEKKLFLTKLFFGEVGFDEIGF